MNTKLVGFIALLLLGLSTTQTEARCRSRCNRGSAAAGFFAGAVTGAALASTYERPYYVRSRYDYERYPYRRRYLYDYPADLYSPEYAYQDTLYTWPGYYAYPTPAYYFPY